MRQLNITASNAADIAFPEIDTAGLSAEQQHELAMLKVEHAAALGGASKKYSHPFAFTVLLYGWIQTGCPTKFATL